MATIYIISLLGVAGAVSAMQYKSYKKNHRKDAEERCICNH